MGSPFLNRERALVLRGEVVRNPGPASFNNRHFMADELLKAGQTREAIRELESLVRDAHLSSEPITVDECEDAVDSPAHGAVVTFAGVVRDHDEGRGVVRLGYEAHPDASAALAASARRIVERFPEVRVAAVHRVGVLEIGDLAVVSAVSAAHRGTAFEASRELIDRLKQRVPIWKHQVFADGSEEWVDSP